MVQTELERKNNMRKIENRKIEKIKIRGNMLAITIGVCAYNEEKNIGNTIQSLLEQNIQGIMKDFYIKDIIIVSSACTDKTNDIVNDFIKKDKRIRLITQEKREGKASAINCILKNMTGDLVVLTGADVILLDRTVEKLVAPFTDENVGMTGGHPIPVNDKNTFMGFVVHLLWKLHHRLAIINPKLGEIIAFRNIVKEIPTNTAVDEAMIEAVIQKNGMTLCYVPDAIVHNKGAETIDDFLRQRRRIYAGHIHLKKTLNYTPSSMSIYNIFKIMFDDISLNPKNISWTFAAISLEFYGRLLGMYDFYVVKKTHHIWDMVHTTKNLYE